MSKMNKMKKVSIILSLMMIFTIAVGVVSMEATYATNKVQESFNKVSNGTGAGANNSVLGSETKAKVNGLSQDIIDIASTIAMTVLIASCIWTATKISTVGDNAQKKMAVKGAVLLQIAGIIYLANVISFIGFSFTNFKIF